MVVGVRVCEVRAAGTRHLIGASYSATDAAVLFTKRAGNMVLITAGLTSQLQILRKRACSRVIQLASGSISCATRAANRDGAAA